MAHSRCHKPCQKRNELEDKGEHAEANLRQTNTGSRRSIEVAFDERQGANGICRILAMIKEPKKSCLILTQQGLTYREIAESLSLNASSVGTYIARARREFAEVYGKSPERVL
ncbi:MAG: hypothetical protein C4324_03425 [Blastocatellia bacterium]